MRKTADAFLILSRTGIIAGMAVLSLGAAPGFESRVNVPDSHNVYPPAERLDPARILEPVTGKRTAPVPAPQSAAVPVPPAAPAPPDVTPSRPNPPILHEVAGLLGSVGYARAGGNCINEPGVNNPGYGSPSGWPATSQVPWIGATALWTYNHTGVVTGLWSNGDIEVRHQNYWGGQHRFPRSAFRGFR